MSNQIDCRGLACPEPVLRAKAALDAMGEGVFTMVVDNPAARENVRRFAESQGCSVAVEPQTDGVWQLTVARGYTSAIPATADAVTRPEPVHPTALLVTSDRIGPEPELGAVLMRAFLGTLGKASNAPQKILFLNRGVHLTCEGSEALDILKEIEQAGVEVLSCGTCLEFFGKRESLRVGKVTNMYDTVETLTGSYRVVTIS